MILETTNVWFLLEEILTTWSGLGPRHQDVFYFYIWNQYVLKAFSVMFMYNPRSELEAQGTRGVENTE